MVLEGYYVIAFSYGVYEGPSQSVRLSPSLPLLLLVVPTRCGPLLHPFKVVPILQFSDVGEDVSSRF